MPLSFIFFSENRYLLLLTENYAALQAALHVLSKIHKERSTEDVICEDSDEDMEPVILFGSSFPRDREYTQVMDIMPFIYYMSLL